MLSEEEAVVSQRCSEDSMLGLSSSLNQHSNYCDEKGLQLGPSKVSKWCGCRRGAPAFASVLSQVSQHHMPQTIPLSERAASSDSRDEESG